MKMSPTLLLVLFIIFLIMAVLFIALALNQVIALISYFYE